MKTPLEDKIEEMKSLYLTLHKLSIEAEALWEQGDAESLRRINVVHRKMNSAQHRLTKLFNMKGVLEYVLYTKPHPFKDCPKQVGRYKI